MVPIPAQSILNARPFSDGRLTPKAAKAPPHAPEVPREEV